MRYFKQFSLLTILLHTFIVKAEDKCPIEPKDQSNWEVPCEGREITSIKELKELMKNNKVLIIDVRSKEEFELAHIKGAISIPIGEKPELVLKDLAPNCDQRIVVYCENQVAKSRMFSLSELGHISLKALGYKNVSQLEELFDPYQSSQINALTPIDDEKRLPIEGKNLGNSPLGKYNLRN